MTDYVNPFRLWFANEYWDRYRETRGAAFARLREQLGCVVPTVYRLWNGDPVRANVAAQVEQISAGRVPALSLIAPDQWAQQHGLDDALRSSRTVDNRLQDNEITGKEGRALPAKPSGVLRASSESK